jgi:hypothetical protein
MSPAIQKKKEIIMKPVSPKILKANPMPDLSNPFKPVKNTRKIIPSEFSLPGDFIHQQKLEEIKEKKMKECEKLKKAREFKANPLVIPEV